MFESDSTGIRDPDTKRGTSSRGASFRVVRDTGIEPVTSSVSGKRSPAELIARVLIEHSEGSESPDRHEADLGADDGIRTRDPHLGKVMRYQLRYIRMLFHSSLSAAYCLETWCAILGLNQ